MKQTINIHIDKLVDKIEINNPNETGSLHERIEKIIFDALTEAIFSPELKNTEDKPSLSARQNNIERAFNSVRFSAEGFGNIKWANRNFIRNSRPLHAKTQHEHFEKGSINVQDFQKLHVNEWLRLIHLLDSLLSEKELRVLYLQILELPQKDQGKILKKGFRQMIGLTVQKLKENLATNVQASSSRWSKMFP